MEINIYQQAFQVKKKLEIQWCVHWIENEHTQKKQFFDYFIKITVMGELDSLWWIVKAYQRVVSNPVDCGKGTFLLNNYLQLHTSCGKLNAFCLIPKKFFSHYIKICCFKLGLYNGKPQFKSRQSESFQKWILWITSPWHTLWAVHSHVSILVMLIKILRS